MSIIIFILSFFFGAVTAFAQTPAPQPPSGQAVVDFLKIFFPQGTSSDSGLPPDQSGVTPQPTQSIPTKQGFTYYCQGNPAWRDNCEMGGAGCGPTSVAMIISSLRTNTGATMNPVQVDQVFRQRGWRACSDEGSYLQNAIHSDWLPSLGFHVGTNLVSGQVLNLRHAKERLDAGDIIVASSQRFPCANCRSLPYINHIFVVDNVDIASATVSIRDPNNCSYTNGNDENPAKIIKSAAAFPWFYAFPIGKQ